MMLINFYKDMWNYYSGDVMAVSEMVVGILVGLLKLVLGLVLSMGSIYVGLKMFDRMTPGIDEMEEIKKGNAAVGILMAAVVLSIATIVQSGVSAFGNYIVPGMSIGLIGLGLVVGVLNLAFGLLVAIVAIYIALKILDKITVDINETEEFKQGNVAVAIMEAGVLLAVSFVIQAGVSGITNSSFLDPKVLAPILGIG
jgi:uncharacterized membrane protein YjfL (UPF0719 family)